jgi:DNA excision repair protein ERCC-3
MDPVHGLILVTTDTAVLEEEFALRKLHHRLELELIPNYRSASKSTWTNKAIFTSSGWPAEDFAGYVDGQAHEISLQQKDWKIRPYQELAAEGFWHGGSGVVVLPCGAGKTIVGAAAMAHAKATTLILVTNTVAVSTMAR